MGRESVLVSTTYAEPTLRQLSRQASESQWSVDRISVYVGQSGRESVVSASATSYVSQTGRKTATALVSGSVAVHVYTWDRLEESVSGQ